MDQQRHQYLGADTQQFCRCNTILVQVRARDHPDRAGNVPLTPDQGFRQFAKLNFGLFQCYSRLNLLLRLKLFQAFYSPFT
jgi:hypothetical protein